jgi:type I restriction enzyme S subunit
MAFKNINFSPTGRPVIKIAEIKNGITEQTQFTDSDYDQRYFVTRGEMLFSWSGQPETSIDAFYWDGPDGWLNQHVFKVLPDTTACTPSFLYYILKYLKPNFIGIARNKQTTGLGHVTKADLEAIQVGIPDRPTQDRITHVLGKLDARITVNRRMNRTLEQMAAAIFKSWFIDFDPTRAKAEGRAPGLPAAIADLFPDSLEDSDLGPIPKGWKAGSLGDVADSPRRGVKPSDVSPTTPYIGLEHMPRRCIALDAWGHAEDVASGKSQFKEGDILFGKLRPYFHKVGIASVDGVCSTDIVVVVPKSDDWHSYVVSLVSSKAFVDYTDSHSGGTKMPRTNWKDMSRYPLALPPVPLAKAFQDHVAAFHRRIGVNVRQNRRLAGLRDTLLPKLLSGEIELPAIEEVA